MDEKNNEGRQVLVIQNDEDIKPSKWTWAKYGKSIAKFKWWVVGFTLGLGLVGFLGIQFGYNLISTKFTAQFSYNLPIHTDSSGNSVYVDGSTFSYFNIISYDNLQKIKESDNAFSKIDVKQITKNNEISIAINGYTDSKTDQFVVSTPISYTISGKLASLGNQDIAASYVKALIESTKNVSESKVNSYSIPNLLPNGFEALDFDQQIEKMSDQYDSIDTTLRELESILTPSSNSSNIDKAKDTTTVSDSTTSIIVSGNENGTPVQTIRSDFELRYRNGSVSTFTTLLGELGKKGNYYVNFSGDVSDEHIASLLNEYLNAGNGIRENLLPSLITEINTYQSLLKIASSGTSDPNSTLLAYYNSMIENKTKEKNEYVNQLRLLGFGIPTSGVTTLEDVHNITDPDAASEGKIQKLKSFQLKTLEDRETDTWKLACDAFQTKLSSTKAKLLEDIESGSKVYRFVNNKYRNSVNYYVNPGIISVKGGISPFIGMAAGLVLGFLGSTLISCAITIAEEDKKEPMTIEEK